MLRPTSPPHTFKMRPDGPSVGSLISGSEYALFHWSLDRRRIQLVRIPKAQTTDPDSQACSFQDWPDSPPHNTRRDNIRIMPPVLSPPQRLVRRQLTNPTIGTHVVPGTFSSPVSRALASISLRSRPSEDFHGVMKRDFARGEPAAGLSRICSSEEALGGYVVRWVSAGRKRSGLEERHGGRGGRMGLMGCRHVEFGISSSNGGLGRFWCRETRVGYFTSWTKSRIQCTPNVLISTLMANRRESGGTPMFQQLGETVNHFKHNTNLLKIDYFVVPKSSIYTYLPSRLSRYVTK